MQFFFRPPAALIICGCFVVLFLGGGYLLVNVLGILPAGNRSGALFAWVTGLAIAGCDLYYRRAKGLSLFNLETSTVFFVIPTWAVSLVFFVLGGQLWSKP